jgi:predicted transcriptional regulator
MEPLGPLQLRIMHYIWKQGPRTVHEVHAAFNAEPSVKPLAYTTFLTVMRNLAKREFLDQVKGARSHRFVPLIDEKTYVSAMIRRIRKDLCSGDVNVLLDYVAQDDEIDPIKRERIRSLLAG